jgi:hypothetical protein
LKNETSPTIQKAVFSVFVFAALLALGSCLGAPKIWDETLPEEKTTTVNIYPGINVTSYNGIAVEKWSIVKLPEGNTTLDLDLNWNGGNTVWRGKGFSFAYNFEAGKEYLLMFSGYGGEDEDLWGINVYSGTIPKIGWPSKDRLIGFVPFINQPSSVRSSTSYY